jgi:hypothetical protein
MKKHFVSLWFTNVWGKNYVYTGLVTGLEVNGKLVVSPNKIFKTAFGFDLPDRAVIHY